MIVRCHKCGASWEVKGPLGIRDECPECAAFMHACVNCRHFDGALGDCRLSTVEPVRDRGGQNFCEEFEYGPGSRASAPPAGRRGGEAPPARAEDDARKRFEQLFRKDGL